MTDSGADFESGVPQPTRDDDTRLRLSIFCDAGGCWLPAVKLYRGEKRVVCRGHALGVLD